MKQKQVDWSNFKNLVGNNKNQIKYIEYSSQYSCFFIDGTFDIECVIDKDPTDTTELDDFESNYKPYSNQFLDYPRDSDGSPLNRIKVTQTGWNYQLHGIEFKTSQLDSGYSKKYDGSDFGFLSMKFFKDDQGSLIECDDQTDADVNCIVTQVDWEPAHDYEMMGGMIKMSSTPTQNLRLWVIGVPDIPEIYGGSKQFVTNINLKFIGIEEGVKADGRSPKYLKYDAVNHTNKIRLYLTHDAGFKHDLHIIFELFKA